MNNLKNIIILPILFSTTLAFADNDIHTGDISGQSFYSASHKNSVWRDVIAIGTKFAPRNGSGNYYYNNADFTNANLTEAIFDGATISGAIFTDAIIYDSKFSNLVGFTEAQLKSTKSYKDKNLYGITFSLNNMSNWDFSYQNMARVHLNDSNISGANFEGASLQLASFEGNPIVSSTTNFTKADLRGSGVFFAESPIEGNYDFSVCKRKNTIDTYGYIINFSLGSITDSFNIRKYNPATDHGDTNIISAKIATNASISGGAVLTLEAGAALEVVNNKTLTIASDGNLVINTDAAGSTLLSVASGAGLAFEEGAVLRVNVEGAFSASDVSVLTIMGWEDDSHVTGANVFAVDETLFLTVNGKAYAGDWNYKILDNQFQIIFEQIPEPAFYAALLGAFALIFAARRRRAR